MSKNALIGNFDRHNANWGILVNDDRQEIKMAPIYDCGSCLCSQLSGEQMEEIVKNKSEINDRIYNRPTSTITKNDKHINYYNFISSLENEDCNDTLKRIVPKIDMAKIEQEIDDMPIISEQRKEFYKIFLNGRYDIILRKSYDRCKN